MKHLLKIEKFINQVLNEEALPLNIAKQYTKYGERRSQELNDRLDEIFGDKQRIYLPITKKRVSTIEPLVNRFLSSIGYEIEDYVSGMAFQKENPKRKTRIGKLISQNKETELLQKFNMDPVRELANNQAEYSVVVSRHPYDIVGMSSGTGRENWFSSCMNLKHGNCRYIPKDIQRGTLTAYRIKTTDRNIEKPFGRVNIKPFYYEEDEDTPFWFPDKKDYGIFGEDAREVLFDWIETFQPADDLEQGIYIKDETLYSDEGSPDRYNFFGSYDDLTYGISKDEVMDINGDYLYTFREFFEEMGVNSDDVEVLDVDYYGDDPEEFQIEFLRVNITNNVKYETTDFSELEWYLDVIIPNLRVDRIDGDFSFLHQGSRDSANPVSYLRPFQSCEISGNFAWADISTESIDDYFHWKLTSDRSELYIDTLDSNCRRLFSNMLSNYSREGNLFQKVTLNRIYDADTTSIYAFFNLLSGVVDNQTDIIFYKDMEDQFDMDDPDEDDFKTIAFVNSLRFLNSKNMFGGHKDTIVNEYNKFIIAHGDVDITNWDFAINNKLALNIGEVKGNFICNGETLETLENLPHLVSGTMELINCEITDDVFAEFKTKCKVLNLTSNLIETIPEFENVVDTLETLILIDNPITEEDILNGNLSEYFPTLQTVIIGTMANQKEIPIVRNDGLSKEIVSFLNDHIMIGRENGKKFSLNPDGSVNILGDFYITDENIGELPIKINRVEDFVLTKCGLTSVKNFPSYVEGKFSLSQIKGLDNFKGLPPITIEGQVLIREMWISSFDGFDIKLKDNKSWWCPDNKRNYSMVFLSNLPNIKSLVGFRVLNYDAYLEFNLHYCDGIETTKGFPNVGIRTVSIKDCPNLSRLEDIHNEIKVGFGIKDCNLQSLSGIPTNIPSVYVRDNNLSTLDGLPSIKDIDHLHLTLPKVDKQELSKYFTEEELENKVTFNN